MSKLTIEEATNALSIEMGDSEGYHSKFDELIERKLDELDPEFMGAMRELYEKSGEARWCA